MIKRRRVVRLLLLVQNSQFEMRGSRARIHIERFLEHFDGSLVIALLQSIFPGEKIRIFLLIASTRGTESAPCEQNAEQQHGDGSEQRHGAETNRMRPAVQQRGGGGKPRAARRGSLRSSERVLAWLSGGNFGQEHRTAHYEHQSCQRVNYVEQREA